MAVEKKPEPPKEKKKKRKDSRLKKKKKQKKRPPLYQKHQRKKNLKKMPLHLPNCYYGKNELSREGKTKDTWQTQGKKVDACTKNTKEKRT